MNANKIEVFALPDCTDCDRVEDKFKAQGISYTLVYDKKVEYRANQLGKCSSPQTPCNFIQDQRKIALQKSGIASNIQYPLVFHNDQYIPLADLEGHDFSNSHLTSMIKPSILLYNGDASCVYCQLTKELLREKNIKFITKDQKEDPFPDKCGQELRSGYPKIYINGKCIGGFNELKKLNRAGKLDRYTTQVVSTSSTRTYKSKTTAIQTPIQDKPSTQATSSSPISKGVVLTENSLQILLSLSKPFHVQDEIQKKTLEANQYGQFMLWVKMQGQPLKTMHSWKTPNGQALLKVLAINTCVPPIWETIIREAGSENIHTIKNYLEPDCSTNKEIKMLLDYYSPKQDAYCHYSPLNEGVEQEDYCEEGTLSLHHGASWGKTLAYQAAEGTTQGGLSAVSNILSQRLQCLPRLRTLPTWIKRLIPTLVSSFLQTSVSLIRLPILGDTVWDDHSEEEASDIKVILSTVATYFFSTLATGIALRLALEKTRQWIDAHYENNPRVKAVLTAFLPYLASFSNLPSLLLSQSTYTEVAKAATGFAVNFFARGTTENILSKLFNALLPSSQGNSVSNEMEMQPPVVTLVENVTRLPEHIKYEPLPQNNHSETVPSPHFFGMQAKPAPIIQETEPSIDRQRQASHVKERVKMFQENADTKSGTEKSQITVHERIKMFQV
ncbi:MAG: hypothetical protein WAL30_01860 [Candidatus Aquirickettsiella sp.]